MIYFSEKHAKLFLCLVCLPAVFANALINTNARRIGYVAPLSVKLIRDACLLISTFFNEKLRQKLVSLPVVSLMR